MEDLDIIDFHTFAEFKNLVWECGKFRPSKMKLSPYNTHIKHYISGKRGEDGCLQHLFREPGTSPKPLPQKSQTPVNLKRKLLSEYTKSTRSNSQNKNTQS